MHDVSDELAALVRAARREPAPDGADRRRIWSAIELRLAFGPPAPSLESMQPPKQERRNLVLLRAR